MSGNGESWSHDYGQEFRKGVCLQDKAADAETSCEKDQQ